MFETFNEVVGLILKCFVRQFLFYKIQKLLL